MELDDELSKIVRPPKRRTLLARAVGGHQKLPNGSRRTCPPNGHSAWGLHFPDPGVTGAERRIWRSRLHPGPTSLVSLWASATEIIARTTGTHFGARRGVPSPLPQLLGVPSVMPHALWSLRRTEPRGISRGSDLEVEAEPAGGDREEGKASAWSNVWLTGNSVLMWGLPRERPLAQRAPPILGPGQRLNLEPTRCSAARARSERPSKPAGTFREEGRFRLTLSAKKAGLIQK